MLIFSKFKDYYDSIKSFGIDKTCVYIRNTSEIKKKLLDLPPEEQFEGKNYSYKINKFIVGFAGELYPGIVVQKEFKYIPYTKTVHHLYTLDAVIEFCTQHKFKFDNYSSLWRKSFHLKNPKEMEEFFNINIWKDLEKQFIIQKVPIFIYGKYIDSTNSSKEYLILNPSLKKYEFFKVVDPPSAFQQIFQFLSGILGQPERPIIKLTDKAKAAKKGFDKWSFRKMPKKKNVWVFERLSKKPKKTR